MRDETLIVKIPKVNPEKREYSVFEIKETEIILL